MIFTAIEDYQIVYEDPIEIKKGTVLEIGKEDDEWRGWFFCKIKDDNKKAGWVPVQIIEFLSGNEGISKEDYSAKELDVIKGDQFKKLKDLNGWIWAKRLSDNAEGWIPLKILKLD